MTTTKISPLSFLPTVSVTIYHSSELLPFPCATKIWCSVLQHLWVILCMQEYIDTSAKHKIGSLLKHLVIILMKGGDWIVNGTGISLS